MVTRQPATPNLPLTVRLSPHADSSARGRLLQSLAELLVAEVLRETESLKETKE
jgi:hypothetical protein